jgi:hypothetical protein
VNEKKFCYKNFFVFIKKQEFFLLRVLMQGYALINSGGVKECELNKEQTNKETEERIEQTNKETEERMEQTNKETEERIEQKNKETEEKQRTEE